MKVVGIIAEFNPFHSGHRYLIEQAKAQTGADYCIVVMSGSYVQRGTPSFMPKSIRIKAALLSNCDLILELPVSYSTASAEAFAYGGVSILNALGVVDYVAFGSESGDISSLKECALNIQNPSKTSLLIIEEYLKQGLSFPAARTKAFPEHSAILQSPNNILAVEYLKAINTINSNLIPITIKRKGTGFHDLTLNDFSSASAIRNAFDHLETTDNLEYDSITGFPDYLSDVYRSEFKICWPIDYDDFSSLANYLLITKTADELSSYQDMNIDIANRFKNYKNGFSNISDFLSTIKTKELTYSRLSRGLLHSILDLHDLTRNSNGLIPVPYTRILGFKSSASELMHEVSKQAQIPLINKVADAPKVLSKEALNYLEATLNADRIYAMIVKHKYNTKLKDSATISPIIL